MSLAFLMITAAFFTIFDVYGYYRLLGHKLSYRFSSRTIIPVQIFLYCFMFIVQFTYVPFPDIPLKFPLMIALYSCYFFLYKGTVFKRLFWIISTFFILISCEMACLPIVMIITHTSFEFLLINPISYCLSNMISRILFVLIIELLIRKKESPKHVFPLFSKELFLIIFVVVVYTITLSSLFYYDNIFLDIDTAIGFSFAVIFLVTFLAIILLYKVAREAKDRMTVNLKLQQIEMENKLNADMTLVVEKLRSLRHDMNNHISILQGLLSMHEYEEANAYLDSITEDLSVANQYIFVDNKVLSLILNNKITKAVQLGIQVETEIFSCQTPLSDNDLGALLGNILENAIEATVHHENPFIFFSMKKADYALHIICDNTYTTTPIISHGELITTKLNKEYHGIGTKNIRSIVAQYHGTVDFTVDERQFHVKICIPIS